MKIFSIYLARNEKPNTQKINLTYEDNRSTEGFSITASRVEKKSKQLLTSSCPDSKAKAVWSPGVDSAKKPDS